MSAKIFPRGVGRTPKYLKKWLTGKIGGTLVWKQGIIATATQSIAKGIAEDFVTSLKDEESLVSLWNFIETLPDDTAMRYTRV
jgi:hypothetical protein